MTPFILAGDVGGTKCNVAIYKVESLQGPVLVQEATFSSSAFPGLEDVLKKFLRAGENRIDAGVLGIAGPVLGDTVQATNLPWVIETRKLVEVTGCSRISLINDLEATAYGTLHLRPAELQVMAQGVSRPGNRAVIAAGTGLGQAFLYWDGQRYHPSGTEGGHVDFGPRNDLEQELLNFLRPRYGRVSYERLVSGPGLYHIVQFLESTLKRPVNAQVTASLASRDPGEVIGRAAVSRICPTCMEAVEMFMAIYGAQAGNLALTVMATGGVYIGGGMITKLLPAVDPAVFVDAFVAKGRYETFMREIPVGIILNPKTAQLGAAWAAVELLRQTI